MKNKITLLCLALTVLADGCAFGQLPPPHKWTATVNIVSQDGASIAGADVAVSYDIIPRPPDPNQKQYGEVKGLTDTNGIFIASHTDKSLGLGVNISKEGYYTSRTGYQFYYDDNRRNPTFTLVLTKIIKPIPMYAKSVNLGMPVFDKPAGFDLEIGDWVGPYGKGINADIIFTAHLDKRAWNDSDYKLVVSFPNKGDGIQEFTVPDTERSSGLRSPYEAPLDGYQPQWVQTRSRKLGQPETGNYDLNGNRNFFFRVRTKIDDRGNIVSAHYGKIYGDFMEFKYYLNPTINNRNVEFDPKQNLIHGLKFDEEVKLP